MGPSGEKIWESFLGGPTQVRAAAILSTLKVGKGQWVTDYFAKVMHLCKDLDPNMPNDLKRAWLA